ncbi:MAG: Crp/Fnr family transcriptional regulator [Bacteroidia bacterium]
MQNELRSELEMEINGIVDFPMFKSLKPEELELLEEHRTQKIYKKGMVIFSENSQPRGIYLIKEGAIKLFHSNDQGQVQIIRLARQGELLGYRALLAGQPYKGAAETLMDSVLFFIPAQIFFQILHTNHELTLGMLKMLAIDLDDSVQKGNAMFTKTAPERLAETLYWIRNNFGVREDGAINILLTREDLANFAGLATETVVRLLHLWESEHLIELNKKYIAINQLHQFEEKFSLRKNEPVRW